MRLHLHEWGDPAAPPLVCLHGVTGHGRRFRKLTEERLASRFRILAPDLRGHGRSGWDPPWNLDAHIHDVFETVVDGAGIDRAAWIGHSFGGRLVLELEDWYPHIVERAVLLDPAIQVTTEFALEHAEDERADKSFATVDEAIDVRIETSPLYHTPRAILEEEMREHLVRSEDGRLRYRYCQSAVVTMYGELAAATRPPGHVPTLLVLGSESDLVTDEQLDRMRAELEKRLEVVPVPGGHSVLWDAYEETADAVAAFLDARPPA